MVIFVKINAKEYKPNEIIKFIRQGLNLTQEELAKKINVSKSSIEKYEYGIVNYNFETLIKIAKAYNLDKQICYIFKGIERHNKQLHIDGCYNSKIIIEDSDLENVLLNISTDGKLVINNSTLMGNLYFSLYAKDLEINRCFIKFMLYNKDITYGIYGENSIKIKYSMVGNSRVNLDFGSPNLTLSGGNTFVGKNINIREVKNLICDDDTTITAKERVDIEADAISQIDVDAPNITINGNEYELYFNRKQFNEEIDQKRCELLDELAIIRDKYFKKYNNILNDKKDELYSEPLGRSLKK